MGDSLRILIVDDEETLREDLAQILTQEGYECATAGTAREAEELFERFAPQLVLCDIYLPDGDGITLLSKMIQENMEVQVIMLTAFSTVENAVESFRKGAVDYILKPIVVEDVIQRVRKVKEHWGMLQELKVLRRELQESRHGVSEVIGDSPRMKAMLDLIQKVAPASSPVLLQGETGTGKELLARTIHELSGRKGSFVAINCAGFPETLLESELFGYNRGAFTGANTDKPGFFEIAAEGTLFLDEISEIPLHLQAKLLRVLESREFFRLGSTRAQRFSGRIIASTNRDIRKLIGEGKFRDDLFYRISTFLLLIPPLRERPEDIVPLAERFARRYARELKKPWKGFTQGAVRILKGYAWPGNARELRNAIERALIMSESGVISEREFSYLVSEEEKKERAESSPSYKGVPLGGEIVPLAVRMEACEKEYIVEVLNQVGGDKKKAAELLGVNLATLYRKLHEHGLLPVRESRGSA